MLRSLIVSAVLILVIGCILVSCTTTSQTADLVLLNGKIVTIDTVLPEAQALAVVSGHIVAIGKDDEIRPYVGSKTEVIDLNGRLAIPGFIDGHAHFLGVGYAKMKLDLMAARNWDEITAMVAKAVEKAAPGEWILGRGWHQEKWAKIPSPNIDGLPFHDDLSRISPDNPVYLTHASGHSAILNELAMREAGISKSTNAPDGGEIVKDAKGVPIGVLRETAMNLPDRAYTEYLSYRTAEDEEAERRRAIGLAEQECLSNGITGFHDAGVSFATIDLYRKMALEDQLRVRLYVMISEDNDSLAQKLADYKLIALGDNRLTVRAIKRVIDGALGSHGAWLLKPYDDLPGSVGLNTESIVTMTETARLAIEHGFQLCTHAIGDRANRETLNIYEIIFASELKLKDLRWRIEHAQHLNSNDIPRFARLGVIASMQGIHCVSDGPWVPKRIGDQRSATGAYVWRELINTGAVVSNGTDAPVERVDPIANFHALVTRELPDGSRFYPDQCLTREEALRAYTLNCAYSAFEENIKGSLSIGKLADIVVLSRDIMTVSEDEIRDAKVVYTIVGGKVEYTIDE
ncbi:MAG: amidohydrolase [FCB group bacterium]|nr:amidohydrolase [FCB group bacterium]